MTTIELTMPNVTDTRSEAQAKIDTAIAQHTSFIEVHAHEALADFRHAAKHFARMQREERFGASRFSLVVSRPLPIYRGNDKSAFLGTFANEGCEQHKMLRNLYRRLCPEGITVEFSSCNRYEPSFYPVITFIKNIAPPDPS